MCNIYNVYMYFIYVCVCDIYNVSLAIHLSIYKPAAVLYREGKPEPAIFKNIFLQV